MLARIEQLLRQKSVRRVGRSRESGDTLIEVLFAVTVFSLVVVLSISIMNQGTAASMRALQISLVRQQIDSQADMLRFMNSSYVAAFNDAHEPSTGPAAEYWKISRDVAGLTSVTPFGNTEGAVDCPANLPNTSFILDTRNARYKKNQNNMMQPAATFSQTVYSTNGTEELTQSQGLWIEAQRTAPAGQKNVYTDFHIRACWAAPGMSTPMNLGTIVRLYEPIR